MRGHGPASGIFREMIFSARERFFDTLTALFFGKKVLSAQEILFPNRFGRSLWI
jgi:hypothetical protein